MNRMYVITAKKHEEPCILGLFRDEYTTTRSAEQARRMKNFYDFSDIRIRECPIQKDIIMNLEDIEIEKHEGEIWC